MSEVGQSQNLIYLRKPAINLNAIKLRSKVKNKPTMLQVVTPTRIILRHQCRGTLQLFCVVDLKRVPKWKKFYKAQWESFELIVNIRFTAPSRAFIFLLLATIKWARNKRSLKSSTIYPVSTSFNTNWADVFVRVSRVQSYTYLLVTLCGFKTLWCFATVTNLLVVTL